jgi:hypothetical protein
MRKAALFLLMLSLCSCSSNAKKEPQALPPPPPNPAVEKLSTLLGWDKFRPDFTRVYPGCPDAELRKTLNAKLDDVIRRFIDAARQNATKEQYLDLLTRSILRFDRHELDSEECDRIGHWFERIMDCVGLESSEGALNTWRYGWFLGYMLEHMPKEEQSSGP